MLLLLKIGYVLVALRYVDLQSFVHFAEDLPFAAHFAALLSQVLFIGFEEGAKLFSNRWTFLAEDLAEVLHDA